MKPESLTIAVYKTLHDEYYFRLRDAHDRNLLTSMNYPSHARCVEDLYVIQMYGQIDFIISRCPETRTKKYFLKINGQRVIAESREYILDRTLQEDISKVMKGVARAVMIDMSTVRFYRHLGIN